MWNAHRVLRVVPVKMDIIWMSQGFVHLVLIIALVVIKLNVILVGLAIMLTKLMILLNVSFAIRVIVHCVLQIHVHHVKMDII